MARVIILTDRNLQQVQGGAYGFQTPGHTVPFPDGGTYAFSKDQTMVGIKNGTAPHLDDNPNNPSIIIL